MRFTNNTLTSDEIIKELKGIPGFLGVVSRDQIPKLPVDRLFSLVVNMDDSKGPGTHWVALYHAKGSKYLDYFDSFGAPPPLEITNPKGGRSLDILTSDGILQALQSSSCGYYCIDFIRSRNAGMSYQAFLDTFEENHGSHNEKILDEEFNL